jgi:hypothetical protein
MAATAAVEKVDVILTLLLAPVCAVTVMVVLLVALPGLTVNGSVANVDGVTKLTFGVSLAIKSKSVLPQAQPIAP